MRPTECKLYDKWHLCARFVFFNCLVGLAQLSVLSRKRSTEAPTRRSVTKSTDKGENQRLNLQIADQKSNRLAPRNGPKLINVYSMKQVLLPVLKK